MLITVVILQLLLLGGIVKIMATEKDLQDSLDNIKAGLQLVAGKLAEQTQTIASLRDALAAGALVTQEQLDSLEAEAQSIEDALNSLF